MRKVFTVLGIALLIFFTGCSSESIEDTAEKKTKIVKKEDKKEDKSKVNEEYKETDDKNKEESNEQEVASDAETNVSTNNGKSNPITNGSQAKTNSTPTQPKIDTGSRNTGSNGGAPTPTPAPAPPSVNNPTPTPAPTPPPANNPTPPPTQRSTKQLAELIRSTTGATVNAYDSMIIVMGNNGIILTCVPYQRFINFGHAFSENVSLTAKVISIITGESSSALESALGKFVNDRQQVYVGNVAILWDSRGVHAAF